MKKNLKIFITSLFLFLMPLSGCNINKIDPEEELRICEELDTLYNDIIDKYVKDTTETKLIFLTRSGDVKISYKSSNPDVISDTGVVNQQDTNVDVDITITLEKSGVSYEVIKTVTVLRKVSEEEKARINALINEAGEKALDELPDATEENLELMIAYKGCSISYWSNDLTIFLPNGNITRQSDDVRVLVEVTVDYQGFKQVFTKYVTVKGTDVKEFTAKDIYLFTINDLHGGVEYVEGSYVGLSKMSTQLKNIRNTYGKENVFVLSGGDNFQGTMLSNLSYGRVVVDCFNEMEFDVSTIGNHEFDWGLDKVLNYIDGDISNGEANFGFGAANIYHADGTNVEEIEDFFIIDKGGVKMGVIPVIGYGLESSILGSAIRPYQFKDPIPIIKELSKTLRSQGCDVIVVDCHDDEDKINEQISYFPYESRVDAIINGHSHQRETGNYYSTNTGRYIYGIQAGSNGNSYGLVTLKLNDQKQVYNGSCDHYSLSSSLSSDTKIDAIIAQYNEAIGPIKKTVITTFGEYVGSKYSLYTWGGEAIRKSVDADIGILNNGGFRTFATKYNGDNFTYEDLYSLYPFDNHVMLVDVKGNDMNRWIDMYNDGHIISIRNNMSIDDNTTYKVAVIDYVAEKDYNEYYFRNSTYTDSNLVMRDVFKYDMELQKETYGSFKPSRGAVINKLI